MCFIFTFYGSKDNSPTKVPVPRAHLSCVQRFCTSQRSTGCSLHAAGSRLWAALVDAQLQHMLLHWTLLNCSDIPLAGYKLPGLLGLGWDYSQVFCSPGNAALQRACKGAAAAGLMRLFHQIGVYRQFNPWHQSTEGHRLAFGKAEPTSVCCSST